MDLFPKDTIQGCIALVTGGSRGIGKGIALMLGKAGATVYISARTLHANSSCKGSLMDTASEIRSIGGHCIPVQCDHNNDEEVRRLFDRINVEQDGRLDILVNCAFGGMEHLCKHSNTPFYEQPIETWDRFNSVGLRSNYVSSCNAAKMMIRRRKGLIINISSVSAVTYTLGVSYGSGKEANDRMTVDMARELSKFNIACIPLWPGIVRTELVIYFLEHLRDNGDVPGCSQLLSELEDPTYTGKAVVALARDKHIMKKSGHVQIVAELALEYNFCDVGGKRPMSCRQLKYIMMYYYPWLSMLVPSFLYVPKWIFTLASHKF